MGNTWARSNWRVSWWNYNADRFEEVWRISSSAKLFTWTTIIPKEILFYWKTGHFGETALFGVLSLSVLIEGLKVGEATDRVIAWRFPCSRSEETLCWIPRKFVQFISKPTNVYSYPLTLPLKNCCLKRVPAPVIKLSPIFQYLHTRICD